MGANKVTAGIKVILVIIIVIIVIKMMTRSSQVYGREVVEAHYRACLYAGVNIGEQNLPFFKIISLIITIVTIPSQHQGAPMRR